MRPTAVPAADADGIAAAGVVTGPSSARRAQAGRDAAFEAPASRGAPRVTATDLTDLPRQLLAREWIPFSYRPGVPGLGHGPSGAALFEAANKLRGSVGSTEYKHLVLGLHDGGRASRFAQSSGSL
jgi:hypothetical protein